MASVLALALLPLDIDPAIILYIITVTAIIPIITAAVRTDRADYAASHGARRRAFADADTGNDGACHSTSGGAYTRADRRVTQGAIIGLARAQGQTRGQQ